jgi:hypothetical protein
MTCSQAHDLAHSIPPAGVSSRSDCRRECDRIQLTVRARLTPGKYPQPCVDNTTNLRPLTTGGHAQLPPALALTGATPHLRCPARGAFSSSCAALPRPAQTACGVGPASGSARPLFQSLHASNANCGTSARPLWRTALHRAVQCAGKATAHQFQFAPGRFSQRRSGLFGVTRVSGEYPRFQFDTMAGFPCRPARGPVVPRKMCLRPACGAGLCRGETSRSRPSTRAPFQAVDRRPDVRGDFAPPGRSHHATRGTSGAVTS